MTTKLNLINPRWFLFAIISMITVASARADDHATFSVGEFTFTRPASWAWVEPSSSMRKAQLKVSDTAGKDSADVVFFQFGGSSGGVKANVDRWLHQFTEPTDQLNSKIEEATVNGTKITFVTAEGTYKSGMPGGPQTPMSDYALAGAIIESDDGNVFVRMTGPKALVKASLADFKKMIESGPKKK